MDKGELFIQTLYGIELEKLVSFSEKAREKKIDWLDCFYLNPDNYDSVKKSVRAALYKRLRMPAKMLDTALAWSMLDYCPTKSRERHESAVKGLKQSPELFEEWQILHAAYLKNLAAIVQ